MRKSNALVSIAAAMIPAAAWAEKDGKETLDLIKESGATAS